MFVRLPGSSRGVGAQNDACADVWLCGGPPGGSGEGIIHDGPAGRPLPQPGEQRIHLTSGPELRYHPEAQKTDLIVMFPSSVKGSSVTVI